MEGKGLTSCSAYKHGFVAQCRCFDCHYFYTAITMGPQQSIPFAPQYLDMQGRACLFPYKDLSASVVWEFAKEFRLLSASFYCWIREDGLAQKRALFYFPRLQFKVHKGFITLEDSETEMGISGNKYRILPRIQCQFTLRYLFWALRATRLLRPRPKKVFYGSQVVVWQWESLPTRFSAKDEGFSWSPPVLADDDDSILLCGTQGYYQLRVLLQ